jgi:hypothetical protein
LRMTATTSFFTTRSARSGRASWLHH